MKHAKKRWITVRVTQRHIAHGIQGGCFDCPVALALIEATGLVWHVMNRDARIETESGRKPLFRLPESVREFIGQFDGHTKHPAGVRPGPISFRLPARFADPKWRRLGAQAYIRDGRRVAVGSRGVTLEQALEIRAESGQ